MKRRILLPSILALAVLTVGILATPKVSAQEATYPLIVQRIAEEFGLNAAEVNQVFEEVKEEHNAEVYAMWAEKLSDEVAEGKITEAQKEEILAKHEELREKMDGLKNLPPLERREE